MKRIRPRSFVICALFAAAVSTLSPATAKGSGALFGVTQCCPVNLVRIDPATGQQTVVASLTPSTGFADFAPTIALDPASHTVFVPRSLLPPGPAVNQLVSVNDQTGALSAVPGTTFGFPLAFDAGSGTLLGVTHECCPSNNLVRIDPTTGLQTVVASLTPSTGFGEFPGGISVDPASHRVFVLRSTFQAPGPGPGVNELLSVNDQTGALSAVPLSAALLLLAFDAGSGALFGVTQCCPNNLVRIDPATGQQTVVASLTPSIGFAILSGGIALDPSSHTVFALRSLPAGPGVTELVSVNDQTGALSAVPLTTALFLLAFDAPTVTPETIEADVLQAAASGAIRNSGMTNSLLAKLHEAASARAAGDCATAARVYQAFVNELQAQSDKGVAFDTAATLVSEAQLLAANCP